MHAINGIFNYGDDPVNTQQIHRMIDTSDNCDGSSDDLFMNDHIALGKQSTYNEDRTYVLVFNGKLINGRELERDLALRGHRFHTYSDAEVLMHAFEEWGEHCVKKLRGKFAFAIWDQRRGELFCARDPFGIKPLYFVHRDSYFVFSSEIKNILACGAIDAEVDTNAFLNYLTFQYPPAEMTMFKHVQKLAPGHWLSINCDGTCRTKRYWQMAFQPERNRPLDYFIEGLRETLRESVLLHMQNDGPVGTFLSGGLDSTAITSLVGENQAGRLASFSIGSPDYPINEVVFARQTAADMNVNLHTYELNADDFLSSVPRMIWHMEEPLADPSAIPLYLVSELARKHVQVVLSGEGADELFGGYRIYREPRALAPFKWLSPRMKDWLHKGASKLPIGIYGRNYLLRGTTPLPYRFIGNAFLFDETAKNNLVSLPSEALKSYRDPFMITAASYLESEEWDPVSQMQYVDIQHWLPGNILLKAEKMSAAHALELRAPFLDVKVAEFAGKIPAAYRVNGSTTKYVLREAMKGIVPPPVIDRPKLGFPVPLKTWMRGPLYEPIRETLTNGDLQPWINQKAALHLLEEHRQGKINHSRKIWALYIFACWHARFVQPSSYRFDDARNQIATRTG